MPSELSTDTCHAQHPAPGPIVALPCQTPAPSHATAIRSQHGRLFQDLLNFTEELVQLNRLSAFLAEIMGLSGAKGMTMPMSTFRVSPVDARTLKHQRITQQLFLDVGIDLDEAPFSDVQPHFYGVSSLICCGNPTDESPIRSNQTDISLKVVSGHRSARTSSSCCCMVRIPSTARSQSWWSLSTWKE